MSSLSSNNIHFNRRSLFSNNQMAEYDFYNAEKIQRSNSLKKQKNVLNSHQSELEPDSISEKSIRLRRFPNLHLNLNRRKLRANSININPADLKDDVLNFEGVLFYLSKTNGLTGSLTLNSKKLIFTFVDLKHNHLHRLKSNFLKLTPKNPIQYMKDENFYEIDLMNIAEISRENVNDRTIISIYCRNFKHAKIGLKQIPADSLYNQLISNHQLNFDVNKYKRSFLWEYLYDTYHYRLRSDWFQHEKWYVNNFKIQFSQFNEVVGICPTLPEIVIVPRNVKDQELNSIVNISDGQRVPIITYLYRQSGHMIIRSTSFNSNRLSLHELYKEKIFDENKMPLKEYNINSKMPSLEEIEKHHLKLRKACYKAVRMNQNNDIVSHYDIDYSKQFWSKCAFWLCSLSKVLKLTLQLVDTIKRRASIGLIEKYDCNWNCVLSSLVQVCIDPEKRTIKGFEPLLSKEWLYLSGYKRSERGFTEQSFITLNEPNDILFLLFLDTIHQLIVQNPESFEFSTFYLILLFDNQVSSDLFTKDRSLEFETDKRHPLIYNPLFTPTQKILKMKTHVTQLKLFTKLYFRNLGPNINRYTPEELLFINELENRMKNDNK